MPDNNDLTANEKDLLGKVEAKIEALGRLRHNELMPVLDEKPKKMSELQSRRELSNFGKQEQAAKINDELEAKIASINKSFVDNAESIIGELKAIEEYNPDGRPEEDAPPADLRFAGEKILWKQQNVIQKGLQELTELLSTQRREVVYLEEIKRMNDAGELLQHAQAAFDAKDEVIMNLLEKVGKRRLIEVSQGDTTHIGKFNNILTKWRESKISARVKRTRQLEAQVRGVVANWQLMFKEVSKQALG